MTMTPFPMSLDPFVNNIVDYSPLYNVEEPVIMTSFIEDGDSMKSKLLEQIDISILLIISILLLIESLIISLMELFYVSTNESFYSQFTRIIIKLFGTLLRAGEFIQHSLYTNHHGNF